MKNWKDDQLLVEALRKREEAPLLAIYQSYRNEFLLWSQASYSTDYDQGKEVFRDAIISWYDSLINENNLDFASVKEAIFALAKNQLVDPSSSALHSRFHFREKEVKQLKSTLSSLDSKLNLELQEQLSIEEFEEPVKKVTVLQYLAAAAVFALAFGLWDHYNSQDILNIEEYWISEPGLPVKMNASGPFDGAMSAYKLGEYRAAEEMLRAIDSDTSEYFLAHTRYLLGDSKAAQEHLLQVPENSVFHHKSIYLSALLDLNEGKDTSAKEKLQTLTQDPTLSPKVQELLHKAQH